MVPEIKNEVFSYTARALCLARADSRKAFDSTMTLKGQQPAVGLPARLTSNKLPVGLDLTGPAGSDIDLLAVAMGIEQLPGRLPKPGFTAGA